MVLASPSFPPVDDPLEVDLVSDLEVLGMCVNLSRASEREE